MLVTAQALLSKIAIVHGMLVYRIVSIDKAEMLRYACYHGVASLYVLTI